MSIYRNHAARVAAVLNPAERTGLTTQELEVLAHAHRIVAGQAKRLQATSPDPEMELVIRSGYATRRWHLIWGRAHAAAARRLLQEER